jgi:RNase adaptor protein for sRNA GlmZ degradation
VSSAGTSPWPWGARDQHRSVYAAEELRRRFGDRAGTLLRHRELEPDR